MLTLTVLHCTALLVGVIPLVGHLVVPLESATDWITGQANSFGNAIKVVFGVVLIALLAFKAVKAGLALAAIVSGAIAAAILMWLVGLGGIEFFAKLIHGQAG